MIGRGHLWAIGYDDPRRAEQVREEIRRLGEKHSLLVFDTALVVRYPDGSITCDGEPFIAATTPAAVALQASWQVWRWARRH
jgi:uncharacterized membrane protein